MIYLIINGPKKQIGPRRLLRPIGKKTRMIAFENIKNCKIKIK